MPARRPQAPRTRDQLVASETGSDEGKQRMIAELARVASDVGLRVGALESEMAALTARPTVTGSRASGAALVSLLAGLVGLGLIKDETTP